MAVNDPNYRYATQTWEADGVRTQYEIAFDGGYIRQSDVVAFSVLVDAETGLVSDRVVHEVVFLEEDENDEGWQFATVEITPAVADGRRVVIYRSTEKSESLLDYQDNSVVTERNLDLANKQAIFAIAEIQDGLSAAQIDINSQVQEIIDINTVVTDLYALIVELLEQGGYVSVEPKVFTFIGDDETTDFVLTGADVVDSRFYDTYLGGLGVVPEVDFTVLQVPGDPYPTIRFTVAPSVEVAGFAVLRGYARPYQGDAPVTSLRVPIIQWATTSYFAGDESEFALVRCTSADDARFKVKDILVGTDLGDGSYFSVAQRGAGQVTVEADDNAIITVPEGYLPMTRALGSTVTVTCENADTNEWLLSGDLAIDE